MIIRIVPHVIRNYVNVKKKNLKIKKKLLKKNLLLNTFEKLAFPYNLTEFLTKKGAREREKHCSVLKLKEALQLYHI